jgi:hypothetical protein
MWYVVKQQPVHYQTRVHLLGAKFLDVFLLRALRTSKFREYYSKRHQTLIGGLLVDAFWDGKSR